MIVAAGIGIGRIGMYCRLHLPARLVHAIGTSLQPPSFREPSSPAAQERDDVSCSSFHTFRVQCDRALRLLWSAMTVHLVNPSHLSFGVGVITPRWLFVLGAATPAGIRTATHRR